MVHVLEVFLEEGDVDDFAGGEGGVVEGGGEGLGISVSAVAWGLLLVGERKGCNSVGGDGIGYILGEGGGAGTNLPRCHRRLGWYRNSRKMWYQRDRLGSRRM